MNSQVPTSKTSEEEFSTFHSGIQKTISFRPVEFERDIDRLYQWHKQAHVVPFWNLDIPRDQYEKHLTAFLADEHQDLHIGSLDGTPMSYWETYWVKDDILGKVIDFHPEDQGIHLLIGPPSFLGRGYAQPLLSTLTGRLFQHQATQRVVAEPEIRNEKMIYIFEKCGFRFQKEIELAGKRAALMVCHRDTWEENQHV
ncbi:Protein N-acetyltransferase, RimJ/RimL family [Marininema mesophilum]|uniref:Lysine N-acyltransferase MbtK n=1 Tax=Marininema mesophilum TaxID=1048340 RepID=A0A1H2S8P7_9BACL|nr:GNAT family N-acetyltransferase [Marininema mesophilum]SDW28033.1 Protein N-acetyltransferase, RimJ/RimL family [Marininema mesophilum]